MTRDKRAKFVELATKRVNRALRDIRLIGNLSNRSAYEFTDDDLKKILKALNREIDFLRSKFSGPGDPDSGAFRL